MQKCALRLCVRIHHIPAEKLYFWLSRIKSRENLYILIDLESLTRELFLNHRDAGDRTQGIQFDR